MKAVIMAGGEGTRLRPLTCNRPKPMVPIANRPVMEHIIELLKKNGIVDIAVTVQYMPEVITEYFGDGSEFGVKLRYFVEESPLGTAGSVKNAEEFLDETFIVISGDALTDINIQKAIEYHNQKKSLATLVLKKVELPIEYGIVVTNDDGKITRFLEKPSWGEVFSDTVNTGIYILSPEVLTYFQKQQIFDFSKDLFPILLNNNSPMYGYVTQDYWCDIGDLRAYIQVHYDILDKVVDVKIPGKEIQEGIWIEDGVEIEEGVIIKAPVLIGKDSKMKSGSSIGSYSVIGPSNYIGPRTTLKKSIVWKGNILGAHSQLRGCVLGNKVQLREYCSVFEGAIVGDDCIIGTGSVIKPDIKIWPNKEIELGTEVNANLVWGSRYSKNLFGKRGIAGEINIDITPEFASRLGVAYGSICKRGSRIGVGCDDKDATMMLKNSFMSGLLSAGIEVYDLGVLLLPVMRSAVRFYNLDGGTYLSFAPQILDRLMIDILNSSGCNIERMTERKIENAFIREDFIRCEGKDIKQVINLPEHTIYYVQNILNNVQSKDQPFKVAINARSPLVSEVMDKTFKNLDFEYVIVKDKIGIINKKVTSVFSDIKTLCYTVKQGDFNLGAYLDDNGQKIVLIDDKGRSLSEELFTILISLIHFETYFGSTVVVPLHTSHVVDELASKYGGKVIRSKTSTNEVMNAMMRLYEHKDQMLDYFILNFDGIAGLIKIIEFLVLKKKKLSEIIDSIPKFYIQNKVVDCSWETKGKVIRKIIEENVNTRIDTNEGVKIYHDRGWALVLPDSDTATCKVISEGFSQEFAIELSDIYVKKVRELSNEKRNTSK